MEGRVDEKRWLPLQTSSLPYAHLLANWLKPVSESKSALANGNAYGSWQEANYKINILASACFVSRGNCD
jgi:hypothetical protein